MFSAQDSSLRDNFGTLLTVDRQIQEIFMTVGAQTRLLGFKYLKEAVKISIEDSCALNNLMSNLYPTIAKKFGTTFKNVERNMRNAVVSMWEKCDVEILNAKYKVNFFHKNCKMFNGEFINALVEIITFNKKLSYIG